MLKNIVLTLALLFAVPATAFCTDPAVVVAKEHRVKNPNNKRCVWCSIEVLGLIAKEPKLKKLSEKYEGPAHEGHVIWMMEKHKVKYAMNPMGNTGNRAVYEFLVIPCMHDKRGVAVGINNPDGTKHMLNVVHYDIKEKEILILDNGDPDLKIRKWDWDEFHRRWNGWAIVIYADDDPFTRHRAVWE